MVEPILGVRNVIRTREESYLIIKNLLYAKVLSNLTYTLSNILRF